MAFAPKKEKITGIVRREKVKSGLNFGKKKAAHQEYEAITLLPDGQKQGFQIRIRGHHPHYDHWLEPFIGKRVTVEGVRGMNGATLIFVEDLSDIKVLGAAPPPKNPPSPKAKGPSAA